MDFYANNTALIKEMNPRFFQCLEQVSSEQYHNHLKELHLVEARDKSMVPVLITEDSEGEVRLNSNFRPSEEAKRWVKQFENVKRSTVITMFGLGNGIFARAVQDILGEDNRLIIYEPCTELFLFALKNFDLSELLGDIRIRISVGGIKVNDLFDNIRSVQNWNNLNDFELLKHPMFEELFPKSSKIFCDEIRKAREAAIICHNTDQRFAKNSIRNQLYNLKYLCESHTVAQLQQVISKDIPVILVAAGPSLDKNMHLLKRAKGNAIILAVDTAMNTLLDNGIIPDILISVEPNKPANFFKDERCYDIPLIARIASGRELLGNHKAIKIFCKDEDFVEIAYDYLDIQKMRFNTGGCVATAAFAVCAEIGIRTLVFVGQDLAYSTDGITHAGGYNEGYNANSEYNVEGIYGDILKSRHDWVNYIRWYESAIQFCSDMTVIDATEGGAKIQGTMIMTLQEAIDQYCQTPVSIQTILERLPPVLDSSKCLALDEFFAMNLRDANDIRKQLKQGIHLCDALLNEAKNNNATSKLAMNHNKRISVINQSIITKPIYKMIDMHLSLMEKKGDRTFFSEDKEVQEAMNAYWECKNMYISILDAIDYIEPILEELTKED